MSKRFGIRLRAARLRLELSQAELARQVGVTAAAIASWEGGDVEPRQTNLVSLIAIVGDITRNKRRESAEEESNANSDADTESEAEDVENVFGQRLIPVYPVPQYVVTGGWEGRRTYNEQNAIPEPDHERVSPIPARIPAPVCG